jgi:tetratricopeptide (TPR) repeat protein
MKTFTAVLAIVALAPCAALADPSTPAVEERHQSPAEVSADSEYNRGGRARVAKDWTAAADAVRKAVGFRADFPEAWNEPRCALRNQGRYPDSLAAYDRALKLRPNFPEALEYLGEAYVKPRLPQPRRARQPGIASGLITWAGMSPRARA